MATHNSSSNSNKDKDFKFKLLVIDVEDTKETQDEIKKLGINVTKLKASFTANKNLMIYIKDDKDFTNVLDNNDFLKNKKKINIREKDNNTPYIVITG